MLNLTNISSFFIGISYSLLMLNKIYFGVSLCIGILILICQNFKKLSGNLVTTIISKRKKILPIILFIILFIIFFTYNSILPIRSLQVLVYLLFILILSYFLYLSLNKKSLSKISYFLSLLIIIIACNKHDTGERIYVP